MNIQNERNLIERDLERFLIFDHILLSGLNYMNESRGIDVLYIPPVFLLTDPLPGDMNHGSFECAIIKARWKYDLGYGNILFE